MLICAFDASAAVASCALWRDRTPLAFQESGSANRSRALLPMFEQMLGENGLLPRDIDIYAAVVGPGSFTGTRIGCAAAKGLAWALGKRCAAVSSLESAAAAAMPFTGVLCAVIEARAFEYYWALFRAGKNRLTRLRPDSVGEMPDILLELSRVSQLEPVALCGSGASKFAGLPVLPAATEGAFGAAAAVSLSGQTISPEELDAVYLKPSQAERTLREKENKKEG